MFPRDMIEERERKLENLRIQKLKRMKTKRGNSVPKKSRYEELFLLQYKKTCLPPLKREAYFHPERNWRVDFLIEDHKIIIEIEGGIWMKGSHVRMHGYQDDCNKYNAAQVLGYKVFRFTSDDILEDRAVPFIWNYLNPDNPIFC